MEQTRCLGGLSDVKWGSQYHQQDRVYSMGQCALALPAQIPEGSYKYMEIKMIGQMDNTMDNTFEPANRVYDPEGIAPTLPTCAGGNIQPKVIYVRQATKTGTIPCVRGGIADLNYPDSKTRRGRVQENGTVCPTLTTENIPNVIEDWIWEVDGNKYLIRIRKLTPRECWRLMDFSDEDFEKAQSVNSNTQLYKQAGNSIVKNIMCEVFKQLIER